MVINPATKRYSVFVAAPGKAAVQLANNYQFRATLLNISRLNNWAAWSSTGSESVCNMTIGSSTSVSAVAPAVTTEPVSQTIIAGQTATFSVAATGTAPLSYQWRKNGIAITGATSPSYTTPAETTSDNGAQFTALVSDSAGSVTSAAATLTVNAATVAPTITMQPLSQTIVAGQTATFSVVATGTAPLNYQWRKNGVVITGATSPSYTTPAETTSDNGAQFTALVSNSAGTATSAAATLTVNAATVAPTITTQPVSQTILAGKTATFSVAASGTSLNYQWQKNGSAITGATASTYTTPAETTADNGAKFAVLVSNSAGSVTSSAATLTVTAPGTLSSSASSLPFGTINLGSNGLLSSTLTNTGGSSVTVSGVTIAGPGFNATGISVGQIIPVGQSATANVTFAPAATGSVTGSLTITSNASDSPAVISLSGIGAAVVSHSTSLTWTASTSVVVGYNVYRSTVSGGSYSKLTSSLTSGTSYSDTTVQAGLTYYYVVTAVTSSNVESVHSNQATAVIP